MNRTPIQTGNNLQTILLMLLTCGLAACSGASTSSPDTSNASINDGSNTANGMQSSATITPGSDTAPIPPGFIPDITQLEGDPPLNLAVADIPGAGFYTSHTATAIINGPVMGTGNHTGTDALRSIPFQIGAQENGLLLEQAYAARDEAFSFKYVNVILVVRNTASEILCFVDVESPRLINTDNQFVRLGIVDSAFVSGSALSFVSSSSGERFTSSTCLPGGERAYVTMLFEDIELQEVRAISIDSLTGRSQSAQSTFPSQLVVPLQYELISGGDLLRITLQNQSTEAVNVSGGTHVLLDESGFAVFAKPSLLVRGLDFTPDGLIQPGETKIEDVIIAGFQGQASTVRSVFFIEPVE